MPSGAAVAAERRRTFQHLFDLATVLLGREIKVQYKATALGVVWGFATPLLQLLVYSFLFRRVIPLDIPDYNLFLFAGETEVRALQPDFKGLGRLGGDQFICTAPGATSDVVSRVFVPGAGVDEDSVTGSAHAVLTPFWTARLGRPAFTAHQASARGGDLTCRLDGAQAWLGGSCATVVEGTFYAPG